MRSYESARDAALGKRPEPFALDGVVFRPKGDIHLLDICELARHADAEVDSPAGMAALADFYESLLGRHDRRACRLCEQFTNSGSGPLDCGHDERQTVLLRGYQTLRRHAREHDTGNNQLFEIMNDVVADVTGRPTQRSADSARGPSTTGTTSRARSRSNNSPDRATR